MIKVWDPFIRFYHWLLVVIVISNRFINEPEEAWHRRLGYVAASLVGLRLIWGFFSNSYSRWSYFFPTATRVCAYFKLVRAGQTPRMLTHNPFASLAMIAMLVFVALLGLSGWMMGLDQFFGDEWLKETHELLANGLIGLVIVHIAGVIHESVKTKENLVASMLHGKKRA